jgi:hypothetical protein
MPEAQFFYNLRRKIHKIYADVDVESNLIERKGLDKTKLGVGSVHQLAFAIKCKTSAA